MTNRNKILNAVLMNQPEPSALPVLNFLTEDANTLREKFTTVLTGIGGQVIDVESIGDIRFYILNNYGAGLRKVTTVHLLSDVLEPVRVNSPDPHSLQNVDHAVIEANFAVAENGAVWLTEDRYPRVLPFITQNLVVIVNVKDIVPTMHEAYQRIGDSEYGFGTFIAGPSKTADIEQSLVLGAHGARSMTVFLLS